MFLRTSIILFLLITISICLPAQTFQQIYRPADNSADYFKKMIRVSATEFAFVTRSHFYRIDQNGAVLTQKHLNLAGLNIEHLSLFSNGGFCVAGILYDATSTFIKLYKLNADGTIMLEKEITINGNLNHIKLVAASNDHQYLAYSHIQDQDQHVDLLYLDAQLNLVWKREYNYYVDSEISAIKGDNNGVEIIHSSESNTKVRHLKVNNAGDLTEQNVPFVPTPQTTGVITKAIKTPDGGYLYTGFETKATKFADIILLKTSGNGSIEWTKKLDFFLGDIDEDISVIDQGYMLLARVGYNPTVFTPVTSDFALVKLDMSGNPVWTKAYGTPDFDYSRSLLANPDGSFMIGAQATVNYGVTTSPVVIRTDADGFIQQSPFPYSLLTPSPIVRLEGDAVSSIQRMVNGIPMPDGSTIMATSIRDIDSDYMRPWLTRIDAQKNITWHQPAPGDGFQSELMKRMPDGAFLVVTVAVNSMFGNNFNLSKFNADGQIIWTKELFGNDIRDIIMAPDGGYLICGMEYVGLGQETRKLLLTKINNAGDVQWDFLHGIQGRWINGRSIVITPDNDILITGFDQEMQSSRSAPFLAKYNLQGALKWYKTFPDGSNLTVSTKVVISSDNNYLFTGYVRNANDFSKQDVILIKTNPAGDLLWKKQYNIHNLDAGIGLQEMGGHYFIAGTTGLAEFGSRENFGFLLKTDLTGIQKGITSFGEKGAMLTCTDLYAGSNNKLLFMGTSQKPYGYERPFKAELGTDVVLSAFDPETDKRVRLYPVPASRHAFLSIDHFYTGKIRISITGISGIRLFQSEIMKSKTIMKVPLDVSSFPVGTYLVQLEMGREKVVKKLVIVKP